MVAFLVVYGLLAVIGVVVALRHARKAPEGYEDSEGFHYGVDPALRSSGPVAGESRGSATAIQAAARQNLGGAHSAPNIYTRGS